MRQARKIFVLCRYSHYDGRSKRYRRCEKMMEATATDYLKALEKLSLCGEFLLTDWEGLFGILVRLPGEPPKWFGGGWGNRKRRALWRCWQSPKYSWVLAEVKQAVEPMETDKSAGRRRVRK